MNPSQVRSPTDPAPQIATQNAQPGKPPLALKNYFELRLRIRYWWLWTALALIIVVYPITVIYTAFSMQFHETHGPQAKYQKQWEDTGCPNILEEQAKTNHFEDWKDSKVKRRWKHLLLLDDSYLTVSNQAILDEPLCLGARVKHLVQRPGPWRYDIVDNKTQTIVVSVTKGQ